MSEQSENKLISLIFTATRLIREHMTGHGKANPFSMAQLKILAFVAEKGTPTMKEVANFLYITSPSATAITNRLVGAEELERIYGKEDRRIVRLKLTKKGGKTLAEGQKVVIARMGKVIKGLNEKEMEDLAIILTKIINSNNH